MTDDVSRNFGISFMGNFFNIQNATCYSSVYDENRRSYSLVDLWINKKDITYIYFGPKNRGFNMLVMFFVQNHHPITKIYTGVSDDEYDLIKNFILKSL